ncbi:MAG: ATP-binding cassette domain-containing protein, partial [Maritimibacter sp.]|nr:ATP-binding cassette domain-containing protein [Maritimibacter sp.]
SGRVLLDGAVVSGLPERFLTAERRLRFGFVFQRFNLIRGLSVIENVMLPAAPLGDPYAAVRDRAMARLAALGVADKAEMKVEYLSGGETQRVAIARALVNDAPVLIADEPTANLDTELTARFLDIVAGLRAEGRTIIMTSHDPRIWEAPVVDRVVAMRDGEIEA